MEVPLLGKVSALGEAGHYLVRKRTSCGYEEVLQRTTPNKRRVLQSEPGGPFTINENLDQRGASAFF